MKLLIKNGRVISLQDSLDRICDILIDDGIISKIGDNLPSDGVQKIIDAEGLCVAHGLVDLFAKASAPEINNRESVLSLSHAAAKGGYTTVCLHTGADTEEKIRHICDLSQYTSCDMIAAGKVLDTKGKELLHYGAFKENGAGAVYNDTPILCPMLMRDALFRARKYKLPILVRCKEPALCGDGIARKGLMADLMDIPAIPSSSEAVMVARDIVLAQDTGSPVHIGHVSTAASVELIRKAKQDGIKVTCSTDPYYFSLSSRELMGYNTLAKLDPPLGNPDDVEAVVAGIADGTIDCIASDHNPIPMAEKRRSLVTAPAGASGIELSLSVAVTYLYHQHKLQLPRILHALTSAPAGVLGLTRFGIKPGCVADLIVFDPDSTYKVSSEHLLSKGKNTPFDGKELRAEVLYTIKDGRIVWESGR